MGLFSLSKRRKAYLRKYNDFRGEGGVIQVLSCDMLIFSQNYHISLKVEILVLCSQHFKFIIKDQNFNFT